MKSENITNRYNETKKQSNILINDFLSKNDLNDKMKINYKKFRFLANDESLNQTDNTSVKKNHFILSSFVIFKSLPKNKITMLCL